MHGYFVQSKDGHLDQFWEGLVDKDKRDEEGKDFLGETGDESDQEAALERHRQPHNDDEPESDPYPTRQVLHVIALTELQIT